MSVAPMRPKELFTDAMRRAGKQIRTDGRCQCPGHDGDGFNLAVTESADGTIGLHCHSHQCSINLICEGLGIAVSELFGGDDMEPRKTERSKTPKIHDTERDAVAALTWSLNQNGRIAEDAQPTATWDYQNEAGEVVGKVIRWDTTGGKEYRQIRKQGGGWVCKSMESPRPLYRLPTLADAQTVYVSEGEKAADAVVSIGLVGTSPSQGSKSPQLTDWSPLDGKRVVILPDRDEPGRKFAAAVLGLISEQAPSAEVRVCHLWDDLDSLEAAGDAHDWSEHYDSSPVERLQGLLAGLPDHLGEYSTPELDTLADEDRTATIVKPKFEGVDIGDLHLTAFEEVDWLVDGIFSSDQPTLFGARSKCLKTTQLVDLAVSLASGSDWLGVFKIPKKRRVLFITGEANNRAISKRLRKAATAHGTSMEKLKGMIRVEAVAFPELPNIEHCAAISETIKKHGIEVVIIDPLYRGLGGDIDTNKASQVASAVVSFCQWCQPASVIISHHTTKLAAREYGTPPELEDMTGAGIAESCGNWWLVGRNQKYQWDWIHDLCISFGGRDEQAGAKRILFDENKWTAEVTGLSDFIDEQKRESAQRKDDSKRDKQYRLINDARAKVESILRGKDQPLSKNQLEQLRGGITQTMIRQAIAEMEHDLSITLHEYKDGQKRTQRGFLLPNEGKEYEAKRDAR